LHHTKSWAYARVALLALGAATVYVQLLSNFIYAAPTGNEPPWWRYSNLYWRNGATTLEARERLSQVRREFPEHGGTVFNYGSWHPSLRWYLREFRPTRSAKMADLIVYSNAATAGVQQDSDSDRRLSIDLQQSWDPAITGVSFVQAICFVLTSEAWTPLRTTVIAITVRTPSDLSPTLIMPPS
jgi:hypothetical protein